MKLASWGVRVGVGVGVAAALPMVGDHGGIALAQPPALPPMPVHWSVGEPDGCKAIPNGGGWMCWTIVGLLVAPPPPGSSQGGPIPPSGQVGLGGGSGGGGKGAQFGTGVLTNQTPVCPGNWAMVTIDNYRYAGETDGTTGYLRLDRRQRMLSTHADMTGQNPIIKDHEPTIDEKATYTVEFLLPSTTQCPVDENTQVRVDVVLHPVAECPPGVTGTGPNGLRRDKDDPLADEKKDGVWRRVPATYIPADNPATLPPGAAARPARWRVTITPEIAWVKFPPELGAFTQSGTSATGSLPTPGQNTLGLRIASPSCVCVQLREAGLSYGIHSPVFLLHGMGATGEFFSKYRAGFREELERRGLSADKRLSLPFGPTEFNRIALRDAVPAMARSYGAESYHLVAHSKGGLEGRLFLERAIPGLTVDAGLDLDGRLDAGLPLNPSPGPSWAALPISLITLGTPHDGTPLGDMGRHMFVDNHDEATRRVIAEPIWGSNAPSSLIVRATDYMMWGTWPFSTYRDRPFLSVFRDLSTMRFEGGNPSNWPSIGAAAGFLRVSLVGSDADQNANRMIDNYAEREGIMTTIPVGESLLGVAIRVIDGGNNDEAINKVYQWVGRAGESSVVRDDRIEGFFGLPKSKMSFASEPRFQPNDVLVWTSSALATRGLPPTQSLPESGEPEQLPIVSNVWRYSADWTGESGRDHMLLLDDRAAAWCAPRLLRQDRELRRLVP